MPSAIDRHAYVASESSVRHIDTVLAAWGVGNIIGQGKIRAGQYFAIVSRNPADVGDVGECDVARRLRGDLASGSCGD
jgi:hypothetical protein